jgi:glyoxylase-like metal-dependent hydrolase (beta-lactamase superfamily II)
VHQEQEVVAAQRVLKLDGLMTSAGPSDQLQAPPGNVTICHRPGTIAAPSSGDFEVAQAGGFWVVVVGVLANCLVDVCHAQDLLDMVDSKLGNVETIQFSGTGRAGVLGQSYQPGGSWPTLAIRKYERTIDYRRERSEERIAVEMERPPAKGGGAPFLGVQERSLMVQGPFAWDVYKGKEAPNPESTVERRLSLFATPHGFIRGARTESARSETTHGKTWISFTAFGKHRVTGQLDGKGWLRVVRYVLPHPVAGDLTVETEFSGYRSYGGVTFPSRIVQRQGGSMVSDITVSAVRAGIKINAVAVPDAVQTFSPPPLRVEQRQLAPGIWWLAGSDYHSVLVEFADYLAVIDAPESEARSTAIIAEGRRLVPTKPIKYLINTHHHWDHVAGLAAYAALGATIVTCRENEAYYRGLWDNSRRLQQDGGVAPSLKTAEFAAVGDKMVLSDGSRNLELHRNVGSDHAAAILFAYLPAEKILIVADDYTPGFTAKQQDGSTVQLDRDLAQNLYQNLERLGLAITTIAPLHGQPASYDELRRAVDSRLSK